MKQPILTHLKPASENSQEHANIAPNLVSTGHTLGSENERRAHSCRPRWEEAGASLRL